MAGLREYSDTRFKQLIQTMSESLEWKSVLESRGITKYANKGDQYELTCPFHEDKRPSFRVDLKNKTFHCFSCGRSGSILRFLYLTSGTQMSYKAFCENLLHQDLQAQRKLGFNTLKVTSDAIAKEFESGRRFDRSRAVTSDKTVGSLRDKVVHAVGDNGDPKQNAERLWSNLVFTLTLMQQGLPISEISSVMSNLNGQTTKAKELSLMDIVGD